jgi:hypothetical protein
MATTTNFGWTTPDNTDLVKNGALAIRTLGSAIDTSLVDLKGGTTGQVLTKASGTDMDFSWASASSTPRIGQVVTASTTSTTTTTSTSYVDATGLSVSITPTSSTSKILVLTDCVFQSWSGSSGTSAGGIYQVVRGSTSITNDSFLWLSSSGAVSNFLTNTPTSIVYVDSPATTSSTTYKLQFARSGGATNCYANPSGVATITVLEILV